MKLLIDSSTNYLYLAIVDNNTYKHFVRSGKNDHSETMMDFVDKFIIDNGYNYNDIECILIGRGPGSYTGLRIAGVIGKVMAYLKDIKLYSFSSLDLSLAYVFKNNTIYNKEYISVTPAKKNYSYAKVFTINNDTINVIEDEMFIENTELQEKYPNYQILELTEEMLNDDIIAKNIIENKLYEEEDSLEYSPNYLRSGI